jgi:hypothetical protein
MRTRSSVATLPPGVVVWVTRATATCSLSVLAGSTVQPSRASSRPTAASSCAKSGEAAAGLDGSTRISPRAIGWPRWVR